MNRTRLLVLLLLALVVIDLSWTAAVDSRAGTLEQQVDTIDDDQEALAVFAGATNTTTGHSETTVSLYAYQTGRREAIAVPAHLTTIPANGVYLDVEPVAHTAAVQRSIKRAWRVANQSRYRPTHRGVLVELAPPAHWDTVGGGSAALSLGIGFAATNPCVRYNDSVAMTGGLSVEGTVVEVEYVRAKAKRAAARGKDVFIVPAGQRVSVPGIRVVEATTFADARTHALERASSCPIN